MNTIKATQQQALVFSAYGTRSPRTAALTTLGFTGERTGVVTGHYLLGNGHRAFNPVLMRFNSADALSPFGRGGLNSYAYCAGDPVNRVDTAGTFSVPTFMKPALRWARIIKRSPAQSVSRPIANPADPNPFLQVGVLRDRPDAPRRRTAAEVFGSPSAIAEPPLSVLSPEQQNRVRNFLRQHRSDYASGGNVDVDDHLAYMAEGVPFFGDTPQAASAPPPPYEHPPSYKNAMKRIRENQPNRTQKKARHTGRAFLT